MLNLLGLAKKARFVVDGTDMVLEGIRNKSVKVVFLASDAGPNTTKTILDKSKFYDVNVINQFTSLELSKSIGKKNRMVVGVTNQGFANKILDKGGILNGK